MEYVRQRGHYPDLPYEEILAVWRATYPATVVDTGFAMNGADFHDDAAAGR
jgi:hypothetical protein